MPRGFGRHIPRSCEIRLQNHRFSVDCLFRSISLSKCPQPESFSFHSDSDLCILFFFGGGDGDRDTTVGTGSHDWTNDWMDGWINEILPRPTKVRRRRWPTVAGRNRVAAADGPWGQLAPPWPELAPPDWLSVEQLTHAQPQKEPVGNTPLQSNTLARARTLTHADIRTHSRTHTPFGSVRCAQLRDSPMKKQNNTIT